MYVRSGTWLRDNPNNIILGNAMGGGGDQAVEIVPGGLRSVCPTCLLRLYHTPRYHVDPRG